MSQSQVTGRQLPSLSELLPHSKTKDQPQPQVPIPSPAQILAPIQSSSESSRERFRPLLPATTSSSRVQSYRASKRTRISLACAACRARKTKCDGLRPFCAECISRHTHCQYTETETAQNKRRLLDLETLFELVKELPEPEALEVFERIRAGQSPSEILEQVQHGSVLVQLASASGGSQCSHESPQSRKSSIGSLVGGEVRRASLSN